jgi:hypothetical protein
MTTIRFVMTCLFELRSLLLHSFNLRLAYCMIMPDSGRNNQVMVNVFSCDFLLSQMGFKG